MKDNKTGTITFRSATQAAIWNTCIRGQLSDGHWENARPLDHWRFWCNLEVCVGGDAKVVATNQYACQKTNYNLNALKEYVLDQLLATGRMAKAGSTEYSTRAAWYMPASLQEWEAAKESGKWKYDFVAKYMEHVSHDLALAFYTTEYTERDLNKDLKAIKEVMKTVVK